MKVLLDECLPWRLRNAMVGHEVYSVTYLGWSGIKDGQLLPMAVRKGFEAFVTLDAGLFHQQDLRRLPVSVVLLRAQSSRLEDLDPLIPELLKVLQEIKPGMWIRVPETD